MTQPNGNSTRETGTEMIAEPSAPRASAGLGSAVPTDVSAFWSRMPVWSLVFGSFFIYSVLRAPIPAVNEPHYLAKAKHYWDPNWCRGDHFLESSNPHLVFYQTLGWLTTWLSFEQAAWLGRGLAFGLLAYCWLRLFAHVVPGRWPPVWIAWLFLALASIGNLAGEWLVGGVESKVIAYALIFLSLALLAESRWNAAAIAAGLATAMHPLVGLWSAGSMLAAIAVTRVFPLRSAPSPSRPHSELTLRRLACAAGLFVVCTLPGLVPALSILKSSSADIAYQANYIQVYYRLNHHLDPMEFGLTNYCAYAGMIVAWLVCRRYLPPVFAERTFAWFVLVAIAIAIAGGLIGLRTGPPAEMLLFKTRLNLLKFYPFRLADLMVPLAFAAAVVSLLSHWLDSPAMAAGRIATVRRWLPWCCCGGSLLLTLAFIPPDAHPSRLAKGERADWLAACQWIEQQTPANSLVITPRDSWAFKWYAQRPEFVSYKDCPQDAAGVVEWNRRLQFIRSWASEHFDAGYSRDAMRNLRMETSADYILARRLGPFAGQPVYRNNTFRLYHLPK